MRGLGGRGAKTTRMAGPAPTPPVWRRAVLAGLLATVVALVLAAGVLLVDVRGEADGASGAVAASVAAAPASGPPARLAQDLAASGGAVRVTAPGGEVLAQAAREQQQDGIGGAIRGLLGN